MSEDNLPPEEPEMDATPPQEDGIAPIAIESEMKRSYLDYAMSVIVGRALPDVRERVDLYNAQRKDFLDQISRCSGVHGNAVVLDYRDEETIYSGNRFLVYALFPECNVSIHLLRSRVLETTVVAIGKSILNRTNPVDVGSLCLQHGGGGHAAAGTCQISADEADDLLPTIVQAVDSSIEPIEAATA
mgnify:CR=1 FL=1